MQNAAGDSELRGHQANNTATVKPIRRLTSTHTTLQKSMSGTPQATAHEPKTEQLQIDDYVATNARATASAPTTVAARSSMCTSRTATANIGIDVAGTGRSPANKFGHASEPEKLSANLLC